MMKSFLVASIQSANPCYTRSKPLIKLYLVVKEVWKERLSNSMTLTTPWWGPSFRARRLVRRTTVATADCRWRHQLCREKTILSPALCVRWLAGRWYSSYGFASETSNQSHVAEKATFLGKHLTVGFHFMAKKQNRGVKSSLSSFYNSKAQAFVLKPDSGKVKMIYPL